MSRRLPLTGVRVIEAGVAIAAPFAASILADLGAEVIKVERTNEGDTAREFGHRVQGIAVWWGVSARNKKCIALDLKTEADRRKFDALLMTADVFIENYRPGVIARLGFGWQRISKLNPRLIMVSISGFGQTGPDSGRPGFGKVAEAMSGIAELTGRPGEDPLHVGFSLADTSAGLMSVFAVSVGLYLRDQVTGRGCLTDLALYEPLFRMAECQLALHRTTGARPTRTGSNHPYGWGVTTDVDPAIRCFQCADGNWVAVLLDQTSERALNRHFACSAGRAFIVAALKARLAELSAQRVRHFLQEFNVEAALVHDGKTLAETPYFIARGDVLTTSDTRLGTLQTAGMLPRAYDHTNLHAFRTPQHGEHNQEVLTANAADAAEAGGSA